MEDMVLCADIGTSSLKAAVIDVRGSVCAYSRQPFALHHTAEASDEWLPALGRAVAEMAAQAPSAAVRAVCVSGNGPTIVASTGETLLWNADGGSAASGYTGASLYIPRILAFRQQFSEAWGAGGPVFSGPEYLVWRLTGAAVTILPEERFAPAYWTDDALRQAGLSPAEASRLPPFVAPGARAGMLTEAAASALGAGLGLAAGVPVYCGAPDFVSALVGTNTLRPGAICDRAGSSEGVNLCTAEPLAAEGIRTLPSILPGLWNASVLLPHSGARFAAYRRQVEAELGQPVDFARLVFMVLHGDGRVPLLEQGKYLMLQTAMQVRDGLRALWQELPDDAAPPQELTITGGQASNELWTQMKSNVLGLKIHVPACRDAELVGDAAIAFAGMGAFPGLREAAAALCRIETTYSPEE